MTSKSDVDIVNNLIIRSYSLDDISLYTGKIGLCILFSNYSQSINNDIYKEFCEVLIEEIYDDIDNSILLGFQSGLTGVGWGIEYLISNNFMEGDSDEVLSFIDKRVIEYLLSEEQDPLDGEGVMHYILARLNSKSKLACELYNKNLLKKYFDKFHDKLYSYNNSFNVLSDYINGARLIPNWNIILKEIIKYSQNIYAFDNSKNLGLYKGNSGFILKKYLE